MRMSWFRSFSCANFFCNDCALSFILPRSCPHNTENRSMFSCFATSFNQSEWVLNKTHQGALTFLNKLTICCLTPGDWLFKLLGRKWRISSISCVEKVSVLRWLSHTNPKASIRT